MSLQRIKQSELSLGAVMMVPFMLDVVKLGGDLYTNYYREFRSSYDSVPELNADPLYIRLFSAHGEVSQGVFWAVFVIELILFVAGIRHIIQSRRNDEIDDQPTDIRVS